MNRYTKYSETLRSLKELLNENNYGTYIHETEDFIKTLRKDMREATARRDFTAYNEASELLNRYEGDQS